jgi:F-type H+-transporting ATPase subunit b
MAMQPALMKPLFASGSAVTVDLDLTFFAHFILFTAFVVLMKDLVLDPLLKVFDERERRTRGAIEGAREMDEQAIALKQDFEGKLEGVRREAAVDREKVRSRVKKAEAELMDSARSKAAEKLKTGTIEISAEVDRIRKDLDAQQDKLAAQIASRVLGREVR